MEEKEVDPDELLYHTARSDSVLAITRMEGSGRTGKILLPVSGAYGMQGHRPTMEDTHLRHDVLLTPEYCAAQRLVTRSDDWAAQGSPLVRAWPNTVASLYAVFDGHGGKLAAETAADRLAAALVASDAWPQARWAEALSQALHTVDREILGITPDKSDLPVLLKNTAQTKVGGCCAVVALLVGRTLVVANCGDCEAVLGGPLETRVLSTVHNLKHSDAELARVKALGAHVVFGRLYGDLAVTRALGDREYKRPAHDVDLVTCEPALVTVELRPDVDRVLLLACDGLFERLSPSAAVEMAAGALRSGRRHPAAVAAELASAAHARGSKDNITALVVDLRWSAETDYGAVLSGSPVVPARRDLARSLSVSNLQLRGNLSELDSPPLISSVSSSRSSSTASSGSNPPLLSEDGESPF